MKKKNYLMPLIILISILMMTPIIFSNSGYYLSLAMLVLTFIVAANALNIVVGYGGMLSLGSAGFLIIGGYTLGIVLQYFPTIPFPIVMIIAGFFSAITGFIIGLPAVKLKGHFLAVATLGFGICVPKIILYFPNITKGYNGLPIPNHVANLNLKFYSISIILILCLVAIYVILNSNLGRVFLAIKDSEVAAASVGVNVSRYRVLIFTISAFFSGIAGAGNAYWIGFISVDDYTLMTSFFILAMVVIGGKSKMLGVTLGAVLLTIIPHFTDVYVGVTNILIGVIVMVVILFLPEGLLSPFKIREKKTIELKREVTNID
ncbi:MAG: branched-chain amino acid ABC transporter permease [Psychrobacillus psychrodurans]